MKTLTTAKGFEYTLEVLSTYNGSKETTFELLAVCENEEKKFWVEVKNWGEPCQDHEVEDYLNDADFSEIETWVDATESAWVVSEIQNICVHKGNLSFTINAFGNFTVSVLTWDLDKMEINETEYLKDFEEINYYIACNKIK